VKIPSDLKSKFPVTRPKGNQCSHFRSICKSCGTRFKNIDLVCTICNQDRTRCANAQMSNEDSCRVHARGRTYSIYSQLVGRMADVAFEDILERNDRSLDQEFALAKVAVSTMMSGPQDQLPGPNELLEMLERFFRIAEKLSKIENGESLNIKLDDNTAAEMRKQTKRLVGAMKQALSEFIPQESVRLQILARVRELVNLKGNRITLPARRSQGQDFYGKEDGSDTHH